MPLFSPLFTIAGEEGLAKKKEELEAAIERNEEEPPDALLESVPIPSVDSIQFHPIQQFRNFGPTSGERPRLLEFDVAAIPTPIQFDQINSSFVMLSSYVNVEGMNSFGSTSLKVKSVRSER